MQNYVHDFFYNDLDYYEGYESFCYQNCLRLLLKAMGISNPWSYINASMSLIYKDKEFLQHVRFYLSSLSYEAIDHNPDFR